MGLRVRKSMKIAPGLRMTVSRKSVGVSASTKVARVSVNSKGRVTKCVVFPEQEFQMFLCQKSIHLIKRARNKTSPLTFLVRVAIQNFLKNPVISMVFGHPNRKISCISPHIRATALRQPPFFTPKI